MTQKQTSSILLQVFVLALLLIPASAWAAQDGAGHAAEQTSISAYLPNVVHYPSTSASVFGVVISADIKGTVGQAQEAGVAWVRGPIVSWARVEPTRGKRDWSQLRSFEADIEAISSQGLTPVVVVLDTPAWAQQQRGVSCGPIKPDAQPAFAQFMADLAARYRQPPYNVQYWTIGNEPDIDPSLVAPNSGYGCWGDKRDPFYGGATYGQMLQIIYPAIKQAAPEAQVVFGGLLLDCDPDNPKPNQDCTPSRFLEGALRAGAGKAFDVLAYHGYSFWSESPQDWDQQNSGWAARGGQVLGKLAFLRRVLGQFGLTKPILLDEAGLLCHWRNPNCDSGFDMGQANYVVRLYSRAWANGLNGVMWYTLDDSGWQRSGMLDGAHQPRPAYNALKFLANRLRNATYAGSTIEGSMERYAFAVGPTLYHIYWTNDGSQVQRPLPAGTAAIYTPLGEPLPLPQAGLTIGFEPIIVEVRPS